MSNTRLFEPLSLGNLTLKHRIGLAPLTRYRASDHHVPLDIMVEYYGQRGSVAGTLLVSEGTFISPDDGGYAHVPGIYTQEQIDAWRKVTDVVHAKGSYIFCQLWSLGRAANQAVADREGTVIVSSGDIPLHPGAPKPRRLTVDEVRDRTKNYATAAKNAVAAGFDGVEIHAANGYLVDQFTQDCANNRDDEYGGSIENRSRFAVEVARAVCEAIGPARTGIRLSPWSTFNTMRMKDPIPQFTHVIQQISGLKLAYLHLVQSSIAGSVGVPDETPESLSFAVDSWDGPILIAGGLDRDSAKQLVDEDYPHRNIVAMFGRYFISTPDLPFRVRTGLELNPYNRDTFYTPMNSKGYTDYAFCKEFLSEQISGF